MKVWHHIASALEAGEPCAMISVLDVEGSAPREAGARMILKLSGFHGTIGGGALEWRALAEAQKKLSGGRSLTITAHVLGPDLGQCCGGRVTLLTEIFDQTCLLGAREMASAEASGAFVTAGRLLGDRVERLIVTNARAPDSDVIEQFGEIRRPLYLFGAGHVGRAMVLALTPLHFATRWIDSRPDAFPAIMPGAVEAVGSSDPVIELAGAPAGCFLLVMTHSHALDLAIVERALRDDRFPYIGVIGSGSKRARFVSHLRKGGIPESRFPAFRCPIGVPGIASKQPAVIAAATVAELLACDEMLRTARNLPAATARAYTIGRKGTRVGDGRDRQQTSS